jgi:hypothetical protein
MTLKSLQIGFCRILDSFVQNEEISSKTLHRSVQFYFWLNIILSLTLTVRVILSLTTFPDRLPDFFLTLSPEWFKHLFRIKSKCGFTIRFVIDDIQQYFKLIPVLREFPDDLIVRYDDVFYGSHSFEILMKSSEKHSKVLPTNCVRFVRIDEKGRLMANAKMLCGE